MRVVVTATVSLLAISGCGRLTPVSVTAPADVQRDARITIPPSATGMRCVAMTGIDPLYYGRFDIPAADLATVLDRMPADSKVMPYTGYSNVTVHKMSEDWWQPGKLGKPHVAEWSEPGFSVNLMFGDSKQPGILTVYFYNFGL